MFAASRPHLSFFGIYFPHKKGAIIVTRCSRAVNGNAWICDPSRRTGRRNWGKYGKTQMRAFALGQIADTILPQSEKPENENRERNDTIPPENEKRNRQSGFFFVGVCVYPCCGGDKRTRTVHLLNAIQALYQMSYIPVFNYRFSKSRRNACSAPARGSRPRPAKKLARSIASAQVCSLCFCLTRQRSR